MRGLFLSWSTLTVGGVSAFLLGALAAWVAGRLARGVGDPASSKRGKLLIGTGLRARSTYGLHRRVGGVRSPTGIEEPSLSPLVSSPLGAASAWAGVRVGVDV